LFRSNARTRTTLTMPCTSRYPAPNSWPAW
jgi:hypothetical protein